MVTHEHKCYYFREGYCRLSGKKFTLQDKENLFVHLTNNAIQKHGDTYGAFAEGNILSFEQSSKYLKEQDGLDVDFHKMLKETILPIIETTMASVRLKINKNNRKYCFEIFGYDFLIDKNLIPWLIEINTNPCLEESNKLLSQYLPRMLDDAFKLTLDLLFPPLPPAKLEQYE